MKIIHLSMATAALALLFSTPSPAADDHAHSHGKRISGPNRGRVVTSVEPHYELFVTAERKLMITFLDENGKPLAPKDLSVSATGGDRSKPTRLVFSRNGDSFISDQPLPEGKSVPLIVQVKPASTAKPVSERLNVNLTDCSGCGNKEYACTCEHGEHEDHGDHAGHGHDDHGH